MQDLLDKRIVLGLSGGIACYKAADLVRRLIERGAQVDVVMTEAATRFITAVTLQAGMPAAAAILPGQTPRASRPG
jgi:phosphopantothenoylcysteine decarboxylase/phosphopantothenate--cysteine ligase